MGQLFFFVVERIRGWAGEAPWLLLLMGAAAVAVFWATIVRRREAEPTSRFWSWLRPVLEGAAAAFVFMALLWVVRLHLNNVESDFRGEHGRVSETNLQSVRSIWGRPHVQLDLNVSQWIVETYKEELPRPYGETTPKFITRTRRKYIEQNPIQGFRGTIEIKMNYRRKGSALYTCFDDECRFEYDVRNPADFEVNTDFGFPMSRGQNMFTDLEVTVDGRDWSDHFTLKDSEIQWSEKMGPGDRRKIVVSYKSRGMDSYYYQIQEAREIRDFLLTMVLTDVPKRELNYPEGCMTPTKIASIEGGMGSQLEWKLDRAVTTRGMGVALPAPKQPGNQVAGILGRSPRAAMLLLVAVVFTFVAGGAGLQIVRLGLIGAGFCGEFMLLKGLFDTRLGFVGSLCVGAAAALVISVVALARSRDIPKAAVIVVLLFFLIAYPLVSLKSDVSGLIFTAIDVAVVAYLAFLFWWAARKRANRAT
jgi:hypothetical protein